MIVLGKEGGLWTNQCVTFPLNMNILLCIVNKWYELNKEENFDESGSHG